MYIVVLVIMSSNYVVMKAPLCMYVSKRRIFCTFKCYLKYLRVFIYIYVSEENLVIFMVMMNFWYYRSCFIYIDLLLSVTQRTIISDFENFVPALSVISQAMYELK